MKHFKGDQIPLYIEFKSEDNVVLVDGPRVRVLHEKDGKVYEDMPWKEMSPMDDGYIYQFDSNICESTGDYVVVYEGTYNNEKINNIVTITLTNKNEIANDAIKIYGIVDDMTSNKLLEHVNIKIVNLIDNNIVYTTQTDYSGGWEAYAYPGEFEFVFSLDNYETKNVRVQIGDENSEVQFNTISLEHKNDKKLGVGFFQIEDTFTDKTGLGLENVKIDFYKLDEPDNLLLSVKTGEKGKWKAFLDEGAYIVKIELPSGTQKKFKMNISNNGEKTIEEFSSSSSTVLSGINTTVGNKSISDVVQDAHGNGIANAHLVVYKDNQMIGETYTGIDGTFTLNLDEGIYTMTVEKENFKPYKLELKI